MHLDTERPIGERADARVATRALDGRRVDPIRVAFVVHAMQVAGAEVLVAEIARRLNGRLQPTIFCLDAIGALGERLLSEGVDVLSFQRRPGRDWRVAWRMAKEVRTRHIEILHAHQYTPFFYGALARVLSGTWPAVILTEHGRHYPDVVSPLRRAANRLVFGRLADAVTAVCAFSAGRLADLDGFSRHRIHVIENGIDLARYAGIQVERRHLRERLSLDSTRRYVLNVGRLHPVKDHATLLRAFGRVTASRGDVDLLVAGQGPLLAELQDLARALGIDHRVRFLGVRDDLPELLRAVDLFVLTSASEAASLTLLEAMASGLPVVVTAVGGNPEIVRHGVEGLLAPRGDAAQIAAAMLELLGDPTAAEAMGRAGAARVRAHYRLQTAVDRYYALYCQLSGRQSNGRTSA